LNTAYGLRRKIFDTGFLICLSLGALYAGARTGLAPKVPSQGIAVMFAPWTPAADVFTRAVTAGGRFVRFGAVPFIAIVQPESDAYADRMFDNGAWLVVDAPTVGGCSASNLPARKRT
jgi:hypothetical protein